MLEGECAEVDGDSEDGGGTASPLRSGGPLDTDASAISCIERWHA